MDRQDKKQYGSFVFISVMLSLVLSFQVANASITTDLSAGITSAVKFIVQDVLGGVKSQFCNLYLSETQNGAWKQGDIQTNIGGKICQGYTPPLSNPINLNTALDASGTGTSFAPSSLPDTSGTATFTPQTSTPGALMGDVTAEGTNLDSYSIIYWTNIERQSEGTGLSSLNENGVLDSIAAERVNDMFNKGYFAHISPTGDSASKEADSFGYDYINLGENIALGNFGGSRDLLLAWMASPGHRANILNANYTEIGVAAVQGMYQGQKVWIAAQIFGRPVSSCTEPETSLKSQIDAGKSTASDLMSQIQSLQTEITAMDKSNVTEYDAKVADYNALAKQYDDMAASVKSLVSEYNTEVQTFNDCIKSK